MRTRDILEPVRLILLVPLLLAAACQGPSTSENQAKFDPTKEPRYAETVERLSAIVRDAEAAFKDGKADQAADLIQKGQTWTTELLSAAHPTLPAIKAVSDLDDLYARMLVSNRHYGAARMLYQKNLARWKAWPEQNDDTARLRKQAEAGIAECDRKMTE